MVQAAKKDNETLADLVSERVDEVEGSLDAFKRRAETVFETSLKFSEAVDADLDAIETRLDDIEVEVGAGFVRVGHSIGRDLAAVRTYAAEGDDAVRNYVEQTNKLLYDARRRLLDAELRIESLMTPWYVKALRKLVARYSTRAF